MPLTGPVLLAGFCDDFPGFTFRKPFITLAGFPISELGSRVFFKVSVVEQINGDSSSMADLPP